MIVITVLLLALILYLLSTVCRKGHPGLKALQGWAYAHRGLHGNGVPENSMEAFRLAKEAGYGIELDVHLLADGNLAVIHDSSLKRTAGVDVCVEDLTTQQLDAYFLENTDETIPQLSDVLQLYGGDAPLIVELKACRNNCASLCEAACRMLDGYSGVYCLESFDPRCIRWLRKNRPELVRGQLVENYFKTPQSKLPVVLKWLLSWQMMNFLTRPDFVSYRYSDRKHFSNFICRKLWAAQGVTWTIKDKNQFDIAVSEGLIPIFEGFKP